MARRFIRDTAIRGFHPNGSAFESSAGTFVRFDVPGLYDNPTLASKISQHLKQIPGIFDIHPNPRTGRVLVFINHDQNIQEIEDCLQSLADPFADSPSSFAHIRFRLQSAIADQVAKWRKTASPAQAATSPEKSSSQSPWHAQSASEVIAHFRVSPELGLDDAQILASRAKFGRNVLGGLRSRSSFDILAGQLFTFPCALLFGAASLSLLLGDILEAGAIVLVIGSNIVVGYFSESRAEELLYAWRELRAEWATVLRNGQEIRIVASDVVPGDVLVIRAGDALPADARIFDAQNLFVDESMLTGENEPAEKTIHSAILQAPLAERRAMLFAGTVVVAGAGKAIVVATGENTELGAIERALGQTDVRTAPIEKQLDLLGKTVAKWAAASSVVIIGLGLLHGQAPLTLLRSAVALGVAAIPEGFPAVGTTALALASFRLRREGIVIRRLVAAETLGAVSVVCADKTGTLTENKMRVREIFLPDFGIRDVQWSKEKTARIPMEDGQNLTCTDYQKLIDIAALNADVLFDECGRITSGSGTERALVEFALATGYPVQEKRQLIRRLGELRRNRERAYMATEHDHPDFGSVELLKGAPEQVIALLNPCSDEEKQRITNANEAMASRGLRVLACAWRQIDHSQEKANYSFVGLVGLQDPPRAGVRDALKTLANAGITTRMLTGDQKKTALAMGQLLGIDPDHVHSRVTPIEKLDIVRQLQTSGHLVAMTGDGVNDGPALKAADVGIAMGQRGTDIARAVADVVLASDDLPAIIKAIAEGRRLHDNVRRAIHYLAATNSSEVLTMVFGSAFGITPLGPLQLLWVNILTDIAPALALAIEPAATDILQRQPRNPETPIFSTHDLRELLEHAALLATGALSAYGLGAVAGRGPKYARSMAFLALITGQILYTQTCRADSSRSNPALNWAIVTSFLLQTLAFGNSRLRRILDLEALGLGGLGTSLFLGALPAYLTRRSLHRGPPSDRIIIDNTINSRQSSPRKGE